MYRKLLKVRYSYEHGSKKLPPIKELVSATPDSEKELILLYLKTNCIAGCPGIFYDEIQPGNVIGCGHLFSDGTYLWDDIFTNYVEQYNIPVPNTCAEGFQRSYFAEPFSEDGTARTFGAN